MSIEKAKTLLSRGENAIFDHRRLRDWLVNTTSNANSRSKVAIIGIAQFTCKFKTLELAKNKSGKRKVNSNKIMIFLK